MNDAPITSIAHMRSDAAGHCILELLGYDVAMRQLIRLVALPFDEDDPYECVGGES